MADFLQFSVSGIWIGAVYGLLALGWVLVMRVSGLLFFPQGEFVVISAFTAITVRESGAPLVLAMLAGLLAAVALAGALDVVVIRRLRRATPLSETVVLLGFALVVGLVIEQVAGPDSRRMDAFLSQEPTEVGGAFVTPHQMLAVTVAAGVAAALAIALNRTQLGRAMRASAENEEGALLVGILPSRMRTLGFVVAAILGAVSGIVIAPIGSIAPTEGLLFSLKGFIAAVLARWTLTGALLAGIFLGLAESYGAGYISSVYKDVISLGLLVAALLLQSARPVSPAASSRP